MIELKVEEQKPIRAYLVGRADDQHDKNKEDLSILHEISSLAETAHLVPVGGLVLRRNEPAPKFGIGSGKAHEIIQKAQELEADQLIFDFEISPTQQRNWEKESKITCIDRHELIITIFAQRAMTREAVLQVELARLQYTLPRLAHTYEALSRQRGGRYGTKGAGETQLELDRRTILQRIALLKKELIAVRKERATQRKRRERIPVPTCAIVGYTNVGKSSLLNALTGAGVLSEDKLFATLDPTTRRFILPTGKKILLTDTVGFIRNLPHSLIDAFRATLEEAAFSDAVLVLLDASEPDIENHLETSKKVLAEIGVNESSIFYVFNKCDKITPFTRSSLETAHPQVLFVSAVTREGFPLLIQKLEKILSGNELTCAIPHDRQDLISLAHREASIIKIEYQEDYIFLCVKAGEKLARALEPFIISDT